MEIQILETIGLLGTAFATIALVLLLWKAVKQMESTVKLSKVQTDFRFRAWIGPAGGIEYKEIDDDKSRFSIAIKNFGEIPTESVNVFFKLYTKPISKDDVNLEDCDSFNLGPMLPNMEKQYWFFVENNLIEKVKENQEKIFVIIYFEHKVAMGKSGYGMISEYLPKTYGFVHRDMWIVNPERKN